jgi:hypothetical protein
MVYVIIFNFGKQMEFPHLDKSGNLKQFSSYHDALLEARQRIEEEPFDNFDLQDFEIFSKVVN